MLRHPAFKLLGIGAVLIAAALGYGRLRTARELELMKPYVSYTRLMYLAARCDEYRQEHGTWPASLNQLWTFRHDLAQASVDAFAQPVYMQPFTSDRPYGTFTSYGRDGRPGGRSDADNDLEVRFPIAANKDWNEQVGSRLKRPRIRP